MGARSDGFLYAALVRPERQNLCSSGLTEAGYRITRRPAPTSNLDPRRSRRLRIYVDGWERRLIQSAVDVDAQAKRPTARGTQSQATAPAAEHRRMFKS